MKDLWKNGGFYRGILPPLCSSLISNVKIFYFHHLFRKKFNHFVSGGLTGIVLSLSETPADLIKSRLQTNQLSYVETIRNIGVTNLYRGLAITAVRNFWSVGLYFWGYNTFKSDTTLSILGAGAIAGFLCWGPTYPLDNLKTKYQTSNHGYKQLNSVGLWKGFAPCVARAVLINPLVFLAYEKTVNKY